MGGEGRYLNRQMNPTQPQKAPTNMANPNFSDILNRDPASTEKPKPIPVGSYVCVVVGQPKQDVSSKKKTPYVEFNLKVLQAGEDVDTEALQEVLTRPDGSTKALGDITLRNTFYLTEDALWRLKDFLVDNLQIEAGESYSFMISQSPGRQVLAHVKHEANDDGQVFARISGCAAV